MTEQVELEQMLRESASRVWHDNRLRLQDLAHYAERCRIRSDYEGERRYMTQYAELHRWCVDMSVAILKPLVDLEMLKPRAFTIPASFVRDVGASVR